MWEWLFGGEKKPEEVKKKERRKTIKHEDKWLYDFLVQFLSSPLWRNSILDFVDEHCLVFDNEEENKLEYTIIHKFKEMLGLLFDSMMEEVGLDQEQLLVFIEMGLKSQFSTLFEQILFADDFLRFKAMMVRRNKEIEEACVQEMLKSKLISHKAPPASGPAHDESFEKELMEAIRMSQMDEERRQEEEKSRQLHSQIKFEQKVLQIQEQESQKQQEIDDLAKDQQQKKALLKKERQEKLRKKKQELQQKRKNEEVAVPAVPKQKALPPLQVAKPVADPMEFNVPFPQQKAPQQPKPEPVKPSESADERKKRLLQQREALRKKKKQEREKMDNMDVGVTRTAVLTGQGLVHEPSFVTAEPEAEEQEVSSEQLKKRRELMSKIKAHMFDD